MILTPRSLRERLLDARGRKGQFCDLVDPYRFGSGSDPAAPGYVTPFLYTTLYGMRKRNAAYSGPCCRVRNGTTNVETDIPFGVDGWISVAALNAASGGDSLFVTTWYDQSGSGVDAVNATAGTQPRIVSSGTPDTSFGKPAIYMRPGGVACNLAVASNAAFGFGTAACTVEAYCSTESSAALPGQNGPIVNMRSGGGGGADPGEFYVSASALLNWYYGSNLAGATTITGTTDYSFAWSYVGGASSAFKAFIDGAVEISSNITMDFTSSRNMIIGNDSSGSFKGYIGEIAFTKGTCNFTGAYTPRSYL